MFCKNCGNVVKPNAQYCAGCGAKVQRNEEIIVTKDVPVFHEIPKCTYCGNVAPWKVGPVLRPLDFLVGGIFLLFCIVPGATYLACVAMLRSNEKNREKICTECGARNMFTNIY